MYTLKNLRKELLLGLGYKNKVIGLKKMSAVDSCFVSCQQLFCQRYQQTSETYQKLKTQGRTRFLDLAMKNKVEGSKKIVRVCKVSTAGLTAVSANFSNTHKMLKNSRKNSIFSFEYEVQSCRKSKNI